ncbi:MAG: ABC transporter permease [Desulfurococcaceae archaeon]
MSAGRTKARMRGLKRLARFLAIRTVSIGASLVIAIFLVIIVANLGGKIDEIVEQEIRLAVNMQLQDPRFKSQLESSCEATCKGMGVTEESALKQCVAQCLQNWVDEQTKILMKAYGLDQPFAIRAFYYLRDALSLRLGRAQRIYSDTGSREVWAIISERLPQTILLFTTANIVIFFTELFVGLALSRKYGSIFDKLAVSLAPLSSMPGWFYGLFMIMIFAFWLKLFPSRGMVSVPPPEDPWLYALDVLWHMALPIISWMIAYIPIGVYYYRTFFLLFSTEEYVEYARARGVPSRIIERRYILRPTLPPIITSFALMLIGSWMGAIITETVFQWPGLGTKFYEAVNFSDAPVIIGIITIYAYLLAVTVIALDLVYGILDPRVRVGGE